VAAERPSRTARKPSLGLQLLAAMQAMFACGRKEITSQEIVTELLSDPDAPWCEYRGGTAFRSACLASGLLRWEVVG
jgi:Protein of unknown function (DUF3631)